MVKPRARRGAADDEATRGRIASTKRKTLFRKMPLALALQ